MARLLWVGFGAGTGGNTKAKFWELSDKLQAETTKLAAASKTGSRDSLKTVFAATADTCKACQDAFRNK